MKKLLLPIALVAATSVAAFAQSRVVKGRVLDETGEAVLGASVVIKGTQSGTVTDDNGNFTISVPEGSNTLIISSLGLGTQEVAAGDGSKSITVSFQNSKSKELEGVVVTALGIKKEKKSLGYSVSEVNSDVIEKTGERNAIQSLAAKAPGVMVTSTAGTPGASSKILLRGNSTFTGNNSPLVVVDGIPIDNSTSMPVGSDNPFNANLSGVNEANRALDINPDDIESVSVLKGPAAAVLYGAQGANGAIIITTKKGRYGKGQALGITYSSSVEFNKVSKLPEKQTTYAQGNNGIYSTGNTPLSWGPRMDTAGLQSYDNYKSFYQTGVGFNNTLSINGGSDKAIFRASVGNYNTKGVVPNSYLGRTNVTLSGEAKLAPWLTTGGSANYSNTEGRMVQNGSNTSGVSLSLFRMPSSYDVRKNYYDPETGATNNYFSAYDNPLFTVYRNPYTTFTNRVLGNVYFNADITKELKLTYKIGVDAYSTETKQIYDLNSNGNDAADGTGQINKSNTNYMQVYSDLIARYNKKFGDFDFGLMGGYNYRYNESRYNFLRGSQLTVPNFYNLGNASILYASNLDEFSRLQSLFGELNLSYKSIIYFNATIRNDWSTGFGKGKSFYYPGANVSWIFSEHLNSNRVLSFGKLRLAIANAGVGPQSYSDRNYYAQPFLTDGNSNGNSFPYLGQQGYMTGSTNFPGVSKPENVTGKEIGLEMKFWNGRLNLDATYYNQVSHDIILLRPVAPSSGYQAEYTNTGSMRNRGIEIALNGDLYKSKDWTINLGVNFTKNVSEVLELAGGVDEVSIESGFTAMGSYAIVGQPYGVFYGTAWKRNSAGQILVDADGYPVVAATAQNLGNPNPDWLMGINTNVTYKGFNFNMLWDIRKGGKIWNGTAARLNNVGIAKATEDRERDYVVAGVYEDGTPNAGQANTSAIPASDYFRYVLGDGFGGPAENAIQDGSWVRLRGVGVSYRFNFKNEKNPFKYAEIGFTGRNLFLHTKYTGVDPETSLTGASSNIGGFDYFNNPGTKSYIINLRFGL
jgi:TonB-linked SusC/RagA family outer membrane protein